MTVTNPSPNTEKTQEYNIWRQNNIVLPDTSRNNTMAMYDVIFMEKR